MSHYYIYKAESDLEDRRGRIRPATRWIVKDKNDKRQKLFVLEEGAEYMADNFITRKQAIKALQATAPGAEYSFGRPD